MRFFTSTSLVLSLATANAVYAHSAPTPRRSFAIYSNRNAEYLNADKVAESGFSTEGLTRRAASDPAEIAKAYLKTIAPDAEVELNRDHYTDADSGVTHLYFTQTLNGLKIDNAVANVNVRGDGTILSVGSSLIKGRIDAPSPLVKRQNRLDPVEALRGAVAKQGYPLKTEKAVAIEESNLDGQPEYTVINVEGAEREPTAKLSYFATENGVKLVWKLDTDLDENYMVTYVNALEKEDVVGAVDWVADADYTVYPLGVNDPSDGERVTLVNPHNRGASPQGWHQSGETKWKTTWGNNAYAQENWDGGLDYLNNTRPDGERNLIFKFPYDPAETDPKKYIDAATTQLFYTTNIYHDLLEVLGFTEAAGNFENINGGPGGKGGDSVQLNAQDGSGMNNANFRTPPDGQQSVPPRMRMYMWNVVPGAQRDGDFDQGIIIHEYTHGLSTRLTGGPDNSNCLSTLEAGGMGEGWGDWFATAIRLKATDTREKDYAMGDWANGEGIRPYPYSTNMNTNPLTYSVVNTAGYQAVHRIGTIWASILYEVLWNLEDRWGYRADPFPAFHEGNNGTSRTAVPRHGRHLAMKLVLEGMKLQPCYPTFLSARDGILDADKALTGGRNACELWKGFAKRGLGVNAKIDGAKRIDSFELPEGLNCETPKKRTRRGVTRAAEGSM